MEFDGYLKQQFTLMSVCNSIVFKYMTYLIPRFLPGEP